MLSERGWTYGAELELSDWPRREPLPVAGMGIDVRDVTMVNSDGVAVDPRGEIYHLGGEIQTAPTETPDGQAAQLADIMHRWPETKANYRSNLHVHVRVPGLREDLAMLKRVQLYIHEQMPRILPIIEPIPEPLLCDVPGEESYQDEAAYKGARRRMHRRRVSHHKLLTPNRLKLQMLARTSEEFHEYEVKNERTGSLDWAINPRLCVNLRQLWETDTVEFRHFPGTVHPKGLRNAVGWCRAFMSRALGFEEADIMVQAHNYGANGWLPRFQPYDHWLESGYERTSVKYYPRRVLPQAINDWIAEQYEEIKRRRELWSS